MKNAEILFTEQVNTNCHIWRVQNGLRILKRTHESLIQIRKSKLVAINRL